MGASASKTAAKTASAAAPAAARKYPTRPPPTSTHKATESQLARHTRPGPTVHPPPRAVGSKDYGIELDAEDPNINAGLAARLRSLGPVKPEPTQSNSSTFNAPPPSSQAPAESSDPSLSHSGFQASASTPSQSIFPNRTSPGVSLLTARYRLAEEAEKELAMMGKSGGGGRRFLDVLTIRQILLAREKGHSNAEIERKLELASGTVRLLGRKGVVGLDE